MTQSSGSWRISFLRLIAEVEGHLIPIWPTGRRADAVSGSGPNWHLPTHPRPISVDRLEGFFLYNITIGTRARTALEVGTGFGYSTLWLGGAIHELWKGHGWVGTLDSGSEGNLGSQGRDFAAWAFKRLGLTPTVVLGAGTSPEDLAEFVGSRSIDILFIDGNHHGDQPRADFEGAYPHLSERGVVIWHDHEERYGVPRAVQTAESRGFSSHIFDTSCCVAISVRRRADTRIIEQAFETARSHEFLPLPDGGQAS